MYIGYQKNEQGVEFIAYVSYTRDIFERCYEIRGVKKYFIPTTRVVETEEPCELVDGKYYLGSTAIADAKCESKSRKVRLNRKVLLEESDVWVLLDRYNTLTSEKQLELTTYRQALRDISSQPGFPFDVVFPTKPTWFNPEN